MQRRTEPPIDLRSLALFERVAELRSFSAAGREAELTTSSVSRRIQALEKRLGSRLLERTSRLVELTEAGEKLLARCQALAQSVRELELELAHMGAAPRGLLRVSAPAELGALHVVPIAASLLARHPDLRLDLVLTDTTTELVQARLDVAVRVAARPPAAHAARTLATTRTVLCAAPAYLAVHGTPQATTDLAQHRLLRLSTLSLERQWSGTGLGSDVLRSAERARLSTTLALREAAIAGMGVARLPDFTVRDALRRGTLRALLDAEPAQELRVLALFRPGTRTSPKVRAFLDALAKELPDRLRG